MHHAPRPPEDNPPPASSGLRCLLLMARFHGVAADPERLLHDLALDPGRISHQELVLAARHLGLHAKLARPPAQRLDKQPLPAICATHEGEFLLLGRCFERHGQSLVLVQSPLSVAPEEWPLADFLARWDGSLILLTSRASLMGELARFDFSWFIPAIIKYRRQLLEVLGASLVIQLFALCTPLFFQVVMDKVLLHHAMTTLNVITVSLLGITLFDVALTGLRSYLFAHTSSRIDAELGARLYQHLLGLPLAYFEARRVGDSVARVRELEHIREFLTGNAITLLLDLLFALVFMGVLFLYSPTLACFVLASLPGYFLVSLAATPLLRRQLDEKFNRGAESQAFLVESVSGVGTIKAMALEPHWIKRWEQMLADYVQSAMQVNRTGILAHGAVSLIGKLLPVALIWKGAELVMAGELTVGQLVAFNMLSGHVSQPIMRLAQMWSDFQQVGISMARLGDILNTRTEVLESKTALPALRGRVVFDAVTFRYRPGIPESLRAVSLTVEPGETLAIVGRSGSGKSTLTKLLQRLYTPELGRITIDGFDLALADPASLRRQIGVVLQENTLFNRSIRANIAIADPAAPFEAIVEAARKAGAHEFISELPEGYDTLVGENGTGLSGGQRQRIAIARALLSDPRILILDEATSALDYESERIVQANMAQIRENRTVIIVAHRLSAIRIADRILVMERGQVVESGTHESLCKIPDGFYATLVRMQG